MAIFGWLRGRSARERVSCPKVENMRRPPRLECLEDRTMPSTFRIFPPVAGPATQLQMIVPRSTAVGEPTLVRVVALDASNRPAVSYRGTIQFTSTDTSATLPADYTFTVWDRGSHVFQVKFGFEGSATLTATDTKTSAIVGSATTTVNPAPVVTHFQVVTPRNSPVNEAVSVFVTALDASNRPVRGYTGTVQFSSSDTAATLPSAYTFTSADHGVHRFSLTLATLGSQTLTVQSDASVMGSATTKVAQRGVATRFVALARPIVGSGRAFTTYVVALDAFNRVATNYTGTVQFTSSDPGATLPASYTFTSADQGRRAFAVTLTTTGKQTITVTDTVTAALTGTLSVRVGTGPLLGLFGLSDVNRFLGQLLQSA